jgi:hypothetical protein
MNLRKKIACGLILPVACASGILGSQASAAPKTYTFDGTVANACSLSTTSVGVTVSRGTGSTITFTTSPTSVTASCNTASGGVLSMSSTRLVKSGVPQDYTVQVSGWGTAFTYTTAAVAPAASTGSKTGLGSSTLTFACTAGCTTSQINTNSTYTATITLGLAPNP